MADSDVDASGAVTPQVRALADELLPVMYDEIKRAARREMARVGGAMTLQTTALVNEAYLKLRKSAGFNDEIHFLRAAAIAMRHALINHAQARLAEKRGGGVTALPLTDVKELSIKTDEGIVALHDALGRLEQLSPRQARIVECRFFAGYSEAETARVLGISERTLRRDWTVAKAWLYRELKA